jgi:hypothetical protein
VAGIAQLFPPLSPVSSADEIATFFTDHKLWIRFGVSGALLSSVLALPFLATIILRVRRAEGGWGMWGRGSGSSSCSAAAAHF